MIHSLWRTLLSYTFPVLCYGCKREGDALCQTCRKKLPRAFDTPHPFIFSVYSFKAPTVRKAIHGIKYFHRKDLIEPFAEEIVSHITLQSLKGSLVPIPMHPLRQLIRGYNHAEALAEKISSLSGLPYAPILSRVSSTAQQVKAKNRSERIKSQHGTLKLSQALKDESFILIDDVTTTGSTLLEARRVLKLHGAKKICAVTIAH